MCASQSLPGLASLPARLAAEARNASAYEARRRALLRVRRHFVYRQVDDDAGIDDAYGMILYELWLRVRHLVLLGVEQ